MKSEKKLQEEILKKVALRFPNTKHDGLGKYGLYLYQEMDLREAIKLTLQERNAEVKQAIKKWIEEKRKDDYWTDNDEEGYFDSGKELCLDELEELLQKLGLDAKEGKQEMEDEE